MKKALIKGMTFVVLTLCFSIFAQTQQQILNNNEQQNITKSMSSIQNNKENSMVSDDVTGSLNIMVNHQVTNLNGSNHSYNDFSDIEPLNYQQWPNQQNQILSSNVNHWYIPQSNNLVHIEKIKYKNTLTSSALYSNGRFSAKTGFFSGNDTQSNHNVFYLQSSLIVLNSRLFNLAVAARFDEQQITFLNLNGSVFDKPIYTSTVGIIGTYALNKNWKISGAFTATAVNEKFINGQVAEQNQYNQALFGTTYSF